MQREMDEAFPDDGGSWDVSFKSSRGSHAQFCTRLSSKPLTQITFPRALTQDAYNKLPLRFTDRYSDLRGREEKNYTHAPGLEIGNNMPGRFQCFRCVTVSHFGGKELTEIPFDSYSIASICQGVLNAQWRRGGGTSMHQMKCQITGPCQLF